MLCKAITDAVDGEPARVGSYAGKFAGVVFPGETLRASVWFEADRLLFTASVLERNTPVLTDGVLMTTSP